MGRLRGGEDSPLLRSINEEVIDLFGNEDGVLHRFDSAESCPTRDPLWDEPSGKASYTKYSIPYLIQDWSTPVDVDESGRENLYEATLYLSRAHLDKAGVSKDSTGDQVSPGDIFECWHKGDRLYWDILTTNRQGFVNDSDYWTQYLCVCRRSSKYVPEREL